MGARGASRRDGRAVSGEVVSRAASLFRGSFGGAPRWGFAAPGRINLIGEHTDYNGGLVLPLAIDRRCVAVAGPSGKAGVMRVVSESEPVVSIPCGAALDPEDVRRELPRWAWYVAGVVEGVRRWSGRELPALDIAIASDVPIGSGLSSSAALEAAVGGVVALAGGVELGGSELARMCYRAEHEFAAVPCGIMDQFAVVHGRAGHAMLIDCRAESVSWLPLPVGVTALVMDTGVRHELGASEYASRRAACESAARVLGVATLRDADAESIQQETGLSDEQRRCALHVVREIERTAAAASLLRALGAEESERTETLQELGRLMAESHRSLRDDFRVSCPELDLLVWVAAAWPGVHGARMTGAGFGGCAIALAEPDSVHGLVERLGATYHAKFDRELTAFATVAAAGAGPVDLASSG